MANVCPLSSEKMSSRIPGYTNSVDDPTVCLLRSFRGCLSAAAQPTVDSDVDLLVPEQDRRFYLAASCRELILYLATESLALSIPHSNYYVARA